MGESGLLTEGPTCVRPKLPNSTPFRCVFKAKARKNHDKRKSGEKNENKTSEEQSHRLTL